MQGRSNCHGMFVNNQIRSNVQLILARMEWQEVKAS
jgi:hypothetical protein